ncbi:PTS fructose-like transporter subunit IIB [Frateuria aurantia]|uniref:protein-N(pi)-phosphohistidine--D-fructose phosphotransferase n=1 Tax=Frateuria aurantia (strain ATCC 33424 / DSM 6220 / KCTC 2777 / LMG 1558 / NBRC 3245 / NCIMB 13370) TaxID=767434 RepID=H8L2U2_FRAAD|nr:PTS fructose-like transporter subunit IIB [Frateuria aurantia]AFC87298.1 PTS system, fructose-specific, IIB component/PTS system, fructose subfamily, IIC component [Frateuria aurantia DSM 6220]
MNVIFASACPSGMVTSYLAASVIEREARRRGWSLHSEIHGRMRPTRMVSTAEIEAVDCILIAADAGAELGDLSRFVGRRVYRGSIAEVLADPGGWLDRAEVEARVWTAEDASTRPAAGMETRDVPRIVAVTACPTGVAHTFMAAEALVTAARAKGWEIRVETRGSVGARDELSPAEIEAADVVVLACDIEVDSQRFAGRRIWRTSTGAALKQPLQTLSDALQQAEVEQAGGGQAGASAVPGKTKSRGVYGHLLTGVSFMLPMVVAGGLLIALSFVFGIKAYEQHGTLAAALMQIGGGTAFKLMVPVLAGYIAWSIADRPGLTPGMIGGYLAVTLNAGFLGGIAAGFLAGYLALGLARYLKLPSSMEALKPILIIPLVASLVTGLAMIYVIGGPVAMVMGGLTRFLSSMNTGNAVLLGLVLGAMQCFDLGGPVNKAAYAFGVAMLSQGESGYAPMAAVMAAGMVPPLGMGLASLLAPGKFSLQDREAGKAAMVLGLCFISEGAIPFMAKDPLRVIPVSMVGGAVTGALSMYFGCKLLAPHGGVFVMLIPHAVVHVGLYLLSILAGATLIGLGYAVVKRRASEVTLVEATA